MPLTTFLHTLRTYRRQIPKQSLRTLRGQALSGDIEGARRGLAHILQRLLDFHPVQSVKTFGLRSFHIP